MEGDYGREQEKCGLKEQQAALAGDGGYCCEGEEEDGEVGEVAEGDGLEFADGGERAAESGERIGRLV